MCEPNQQTKPSMPERKPEEMTMIETISSVVIAGTMKLTTACSSFVNWFIPQVMMFITEVTPVITNLFNEGFRAFNAVARQKKRNRDRNQRRRNKNYQLAPVRELFRMYSQSNNQNFHSRSSRLVSEK